MQEHVAAIAIIQSMFSISDLACARSFLSSSGTNIGPNPIPTIAPKGVANDPILIASALYLSGNHTVAILLIAVQRKGCTLAIATWPTSMTLKSVAKYRPQEPRIVTIAPILMTAWRFAQIAGTVRKVNATAEIKKTTTPRFTKVWVTPQA